MKVLFSVRAAELNHDLHLQFMGVVFHFGYFPRTFVCKASHFMADALHALTPQEQGLRLFNRIRDHNRSLASVENLKLEDFDCRYLVVRSAWVETAEDLLIDWFKPVWNNELKVCYGFGKHGDSAGTRSNERSPWDTLHPGRPWAKSADNTPNKKSIVQIKADIAGHFKKYPPKK